MNDSSENPPEKVDNEDSEPPDNEADAEHQLDETDGRCGFRACSRSQSTHSPATPSEAQSLRQCRRCGPSR